MALKIIDLGSCWARLLNVFGISDYDMACDSDTLRASYEEAAEKLKEQMSKQVRHPITVWPSWNDRCTLFNALVQSDDFYGALGRMFDIDENSSVIQLFQHNALDAKKRGFVSKYAISKACYEDIVDHLGIQAGHGFDMEMLVRKSGITDDADGLCQALTGLSSDPYPVSGDTTTGLMATVPGNVEMCELIASGKGLGLKYHLDGASIRLDGFVDIDWMEFSSALQTHNRMTPRTERNLVSADANTTAEQNRFCATFDLLSSFGLVSVIIKPWSQPSEKSPNGSPGLIGIVGGVDIKTWLACLAMKKGVNKAE